MLAKRGCGGSEGADERRGAVGAAPGGEAGEEEGGRGGVQGEDVWGDGGREDDAEEGSRSCWRIAAPMRAV